MSDSRHIRPFKESQIHFVMEQYEKGEGVAAIAEGLNSHPHFSRLVGQELYSGNDVQILLERFKIRTPQDAARIGSILKSTTTGHGGSTPPISVQPAPVLEKPVSAAVAKRDPGASRRRAQKAKGKEQADAPAVGEAFEEKAAPLDDLETMLAVKKDDAAVVFKPVFLKDFKEGETYVYPGLGAVIFQGRKETEAAGYKLETFTFQERFTKQFASPQIVRVPKPQLEKRGIYDLPSSQVMDDVLYKLRHGKNEMRGMPKHAEPRKKFFEQFVASASLSDLADVVIFGFRDTSLTNQTQMGVEAGNKSVRILGSVIAAVKNITLDEGASLVNRAVGKLTLDQLSGYNDGRMPPPAMK